MNKLKPDFYLRDTITVAKDLIGCFLVRKTKSGVIIGRIDETEAYIGTIDKACHAYDNKRTKRTEPLFNQGGIAYIYLIYGMYYCLNAVTEEKDFPAAVLIRSAEIIDGREAAIFNRYGKTESELTKNQKINLSNGPGKLCRAFNVEKDLNCESLSGDELFICDEIEHHKKTTSKIVSSKRIGIDYAEEAKDFLWRFNG